MSLPGFRKIALNSLLSRVLLGYIWCAHGVLVREETSEIVQIKIFKSNVKSLDLPMHGY